MTDLDAGLKHQLGLRRHLLLLLLLLPLLMVMVMTRLRLLESSQVRYLSPLSHRETVCC